MWKGGGTTSAKGGYGGANPKVVASMEQGLRVCHGQQDNIE